MINRWKISSEHSLFDLKLHMVWEYRDLLILMVRRDFVSFYKQTILGPLWFIVQPLFTTITYTFVFGHLAGISTDHLPGPLFYLAGITTWNYFSDCLIKTSSVFRDNADLFGKVYFPRLIMPLSIVVSNLVRFIVQFMLFIVMLIYFVHVQPDIHPNRYMILLPVLIFLMAALGLGLGMIVSALTTKYRDLIYLLSFGMQLFMYATPVILPYSAVPDKYKWLIKLNPMTHIIEAFRFGFLGKGSFSWLLLGYTAIFTGLTICIGILIFNKIEKSFIDTV